MKLTNKKCVNLCYVVIIVGVISIVCLLAGCIQQNEQPDQPSAWVGSNDKYAFYNLNSHEYTLVIKDVDANVRILNINSTTHSMLPTISDNSFILVMDVDNLSSITKGDIVAYTKDNLLISHRVIDIGFDIEGRFFITKGDNCTNDDGKIRDGQIRGVVVGIFY